MMGAKNSVRDTVLSVLKSTAIGRAAAAEVKADEAVRQERVAARSKLEEAREDRERIPALAEAVEKTRAAAEAEMERLNGELYAAQRAHNDLARGSDAKYSRGERVLRRTAPPSVSESGPVLRAVEAAERHLRVHLIGIEEGHVRRQAKSKPLVDAPEDTNPIDAAKALIATNDEALELMDELRFAIDELRDLQLEVEVDPTVVSEIIDALPTRCVHKCSHDFAIQSSLTELESKEDAA